MCVCISVAIQHVATSDHHRRHASRFNAFLRYEKPGAELVPTSA